MFSKKSFKLGSHFNFISKLTPQGVAFTHPVFIAKKTTPLLPGNKKNKFEYEWYVKEEENIFTLLSELISCALLNLFDPEQPKVRAFINPLKKMYTVSKKVTLNHEKHQKLAEKVKYQNYKGLGIIEVMGLWLNELDLKPDNYGVDDKNKHVMKVDGEFCLREAFRSFKKLDRKKENEFTAKDFESLPLVSQYRPVNWLDQYKCIVNIIRDEKDPSKTKKEEKHVHNPSSCFSPIINGPFRDEVNATKLGILLFNDTMIETFVNHYTREFIEAYILLKAPDQYTTQYIRQIPKLIIEELKYRRQMTFTAAKESTLFKSYLSNLDRVFSDLTAFSDLITNYKAPSKNKIFANLKKESFENQLIAVLTEVSRDLVPSANLKLKEKLKIKPDLQIPENNQNNNIKDLLTFKFFGSSSQTENEISPNTLKLIDSFLADDLTTLNELEPSTKKQKVEDPVIRTESMQNK